MSDYAAYYDEFAAEVLTKLQAPVNVETRDALVCWVGGESGWTGQNVAVVDNDPLNIKYLVFTGYGIQPDGERAITNVDDGTQGYGVFSSLARGADATARYLSVPAHGYPAIVKALRAGGPHETILNAIAASDWAASHYGYPQTNHLLGYFDFVRSCNHPIAPTPAPQPEATDPMTNLFPITAHRVVDLPAGTLLEQTPGGSRYSLLSSPATLGLIGATATHFQVADGDAGVYVKRDGLTPRTQDINAGK